LFEQDRKNRDWKLAQFKAYLKEESQDLANARRDRDIEATKSRIVSELKRLKIKKYFEPPILDPMAVHARLKDGSLKTVNSFRVQVKIKNDAIKADKLNRQQL